MLEKNEGWFQQNSPLFNGLVTEIPNICSLSKNTCPITETRFVAGGIDYGLVARVNPEVMIYELRLFSPESSYPIYNPEMRKNEHYLTSREIALLHLEAWEGRDPVEIHIDGVTRPEMEGQGILHAFAQSSRLVLDTTLRLWESYLRNKRVVAIVEDASKAFTPGKNHSGLSGFLATKYGAVFINGCYILELK